MQENLRSGRFLLPATCFLPPALRPALLLSPRLAGKDLRVDAFRIAKHNEANIAHILLGYPLNI
jgi:hypothetical protein